MAEGALKIKLGINLKNCSRSLRLEYGELTRVGGRRGTGHEKVFICIDMWKYLYQ